MEPSASLRPSCWRLSGLERQPGDPAVKGPVAVGGSGDRLDCLGLDSQALAAGVLEHVSPA